MAMRSLIEINKDIETHEAAIKALRQEVTNFRKQCPHPDGFLDVKYSEVNDNCGGPPIYEYTLAMAKCNLCGHEKTLQFDKNANTRGVSYVGLGTTRPTAAQVIHQP